MKKKKFSLTTTVILVFSLITVSTSWMTRCAYSTVKVLPPQTGVYHGAFAFGGTEDVVSAQRINYFENLVGKEIAWAYFSNNWFNDIKFPKTAVSAIRNKGRIPYIRMMARSNFNTGQDPVYTLHRIVIGRFDKQLIHWAQEARSAGPLIVEFGTEVNGSWFPWNGKYNGAGRKTGFGSRLKADGPERFRHAYRHIINICRRHKADNITWVFHVNYDSWPVTWWNRMKAYYPGDNYIDWIGVSAYGAQTVHDDWISFAEIMNDAYPQVCAISPNKPLALVEFGVVENPSAGNKALWLTEALQLIKNSAYPRIKAVSYWHESWRNGDGTVSNLKIDSSPQSLAVYRQEIADQFYLTNLIIKRN